MKARVMDRVTALSRRQLLVLLTVPALVVVLLIVLPRGEVRSGTAYVPRAVALFKGSDVRVLGVKIGKVTAVEPKGTKVAVDFEYDGDVKIPADAKAAIIAPSVVSDRYLQLLPAYTSGPVLPDNVVIPMDRTAVPVELDRIMASLDDLNVALGPAGANKNGALSRFLDVSARNLDGNGEQMHAMVRNLSKAIQTLAEGGEDTFASLSNLNTLTTALAQNDRYVREFTESLAAVSAQLAGEREEMAASLRNLGIALAEVATFAAGNKKLLTKDIAQLTDLSSLMVKHQDEWKELLDVAPLGISNLYNVFDPRLGTITARGVHEYMEQPGLFVCEIMRVSGQEVDCDELQKMMPPLGEFH